MHFLLLHTVFFTRKSLSFPPITMYLWVVNSTLIAFLTNMWADRQKSCGIWIPWRFTWGAERIVIHKKSFAAYGYTTQENHMPTNHSAYKRTKEYYGAAIQARALHIGQATKWAVDSLLASMNFPQQSYRTCQGIFSLASRYGERRIESACSIIRSGSSGFTLAMLRNILQKNLDQNHTETISTTPLNTQVRGSQEYYQINVSDRLTPSISINCSFLSL